ncbi:sensor histidine kinase [uncultured Parabacteroides sp.]|uniref:sensor histidine kinase n=1 Tax=uncultured Parabacteroides sp. TaxID=512312 RepID=UPI00258686AF|nr:sensor histidine kinase [uncultured Parabacteroides sp.]
MEKKKTILLFVLLIAASLLMCILTFAILSGNENSQKIIQNFVYNMPVCFLIGVIDYKIVNLSQQRKRKTTSIHIISDILLTALLIAILSGAANYLISLFRSHEFNLMKSVLPIILWNSIIVLFIEIFFYHKRQIEHEKQLATIEKKKALYQFQVLKNQINPHFLFNSLNILASLAYQDAARTNLFAKKLSNVYRYLLTTHERPTVTLAEELSFVDSYLYLEQIRFGDTLQVEIENREDCQTCHVIPASIQMLVENALKHNISTSKSPLIIQIRIKNETITVSNNLQLRNYVASNATGLKNLQHQYSLYGKAIEVAKDEKTFTVKMPFIQSVHFFT